MEKNKIVGLGIGIIGVIFLFGLLPFMIISSQSQSSDSTSESTSSSSKVEYGKMPNFVGDNIGDNGAITWIGDNNLSYTFDNKDYTRSISLTLKNTGTSFPLNKTNLDQYKIVSQSIKAGTKLSFNKDYTVNVKLVRDSDAISSSASAASKSSEQSQSQSEMASSETSSSDVDSKKTPIEISPDDMENAYINSQLVDGQKYKLTGVVANDVTTEFLYLETTDGSNMSFEAASKSKIEKFKKGMTVNMVVEEGSGILPKIISISQDKTKKYDKNAELNEQLTFAQNEVNQAAGMELISSYDIEDSVVYVQLNPDVLLQNDTQLKVMLDNAHSIMKNDGITSYMVFMVGDSRIARTTAFSGVKLLN